MGILETEVMRGFIRMCDDGWHLGWHERNGGNLTYRMTQDEKDSCKKWFSTSGAWNAMGVTAKDLAGEFFIATGSGKYMRNVASDPADSLCILEINESGDSWRIVWGLQNGGRPTSEFPSHFLNHHVRKQATNGSHRVIYHAHPTSIIALTFVIPLTSRDFTRVLWRSATECPVVFPGGVGVVEWMVPGGADIARATSELMARFDAVVWAHHGLFVSGPDFDTAFGLMHTIEKSADIYIKAMSCGVGIRQTITDDNLRAIARDFKVVLAEEFLD